MRRLGLVTIVFSSTLACANAQREPALSAEPLASCDAPASFKRDGASVVDAARDYVETCSLATTSSLTGTLVRFPTVRAREGKDGPAFVAMRDYLAAWSERAGFSFESFDGDPWVVSWGEGEPSVAFVMHADVVPVVDDPKAERPHIPAGWTRPPFEMTREGDRLYGRGTEDDKGPIASVLETMRVLSELGYQPRGRILAILGTGEEHDWDLMAAYAKSEPHANFVVSIDASFPVVVAESGFVAWRLALPASAKSKSKSQAKEKCIAAVDARAGQFLTQVPGEATLVLENADPAKVEAAAAEVSAAREHVTHALERDGSRLTVRMTGRAVHSSVADEGTNALWALSAVASKLPLCPGGIAGALQAVHGYFDGDHWGERLGLAYAHPVMGKLLVSPTMLRAEEGQVVLSINMRRPEGLDAEAFGRRLDAALATLKTNVSADIGEAEKGRYVGQPAIADTQGPLVSTLLDVYRHATGDTNAEVLSIRGGTYARLFPGAVSFGPSIPGREYRGHAPDEYLETEALMLMNRTLLEALVRLDALTGR